MSPVPPSEPFLEPGQLYRFAWLLYLALALAGVVWIGLRLGVIPLSLFLRTAPAALGADLAAGGAAGALLLAIWEGARRLPWTAYRARRLEAHLRDLLGPLSGAEAVGLALLSGFAEELFFRGAVQGAWGWIPATVLFALLHTGPGAPFRLWTGFAAVAGLVFAGLMIWRGSLLAPVVAHVMVNGVNLHRLVRGAEGSEDDEE